VIEKEPDHPRQVNPVADRDLSAIALKCLAKDPAGRYATAGELADDLRRWLDGEPTKARPPGLLAQTWRWLRRNLAAAATVVVLGVGWGGVTGTALIISNGPDYRPLAMLAAGTGPFNPLGWAALVRQSPPARYATLSAAVGLALAAGWLLRAGTRPKTGRAALAFAAVTGLLAGVVCFLFLGPFLAVERPLQLRPLHDRDQPTTKRRADGTAEVSHPDREYLARFLPPEKRALDYPGADRDLELLLFAAVRADRIYVASVGIWCGQLFAVGLFLGLSLASTWAVDYPARTGRRLPRRFCYLELYPPAAVLVVASLALLPLGLVLRLDPKGGAVLAAVVVLWLGLAVLVAAAQAAVARRCHPLARLGLQRVGWGGLVAGLLAVV
jgi:hypothetical protein